jgi:hypothetical protein
MAPLAPPLCSPHRGEAQGGDLAADDLAVGELSAGQGLPLLWVTDLWGQFDPGGLAIATQ